MYQQRSSIRIGGPLTPMVKRLMIINGGIFLIQQFVNLMNPGFLEVLFGLSHAGLIEQFHVWQVFTYMFLHGGWLHIIFNLLVLWMFAGDLEQLWGSSFFLKYYLYAGTGAGLFIAFMNAFTYYRFEANPITIGASGALYAILLAYGLTWPNREVLIWFIFPVKIKYLIIVIGLIEFFGTLSSATSGGTGISHIGHLGGIISGFIYIKIKGNRRRSGGKSSSDKKQENPVSELFRKRRLEKKKKDIDTRIKAKKIIDELLEKISREGMSSLTSEEKSRLEWARRHYYPGNDETLH